MEETVISNSTYIIPRDKSHIKEFISNLPDSPGVYKFLDKSNFPLYIGKAKRIKKRLPSYFRTSSQTKKIKNLIEEANAMEFSLTNTELESLLLEQFLIKEFKPKYNVQFKDDKGYPWIKIDDKNNYPSAKLFLGKKKKDGKYFGPFPNSYAVRDALKLIQKTFKLRNCSDSYFKNRSRPCLQYEIGRCSAPCVGFINTQDYLKEVKGAKFLLTGKSEELVKDFYTSMDKFSEKKDYEKAAIYRDRVSALRDIQRSQSVTGFKQSRDAIHFSKSQGSIKIGVTHVSQGWITGHNNFTQTEEYIENNILERFIINKYSSDKFCPPVLVISQILENKSLIEKALTKIHSKKISLITKPGKKDRGLLELSKANTEYVFKKDKVDKQISLKIDELIKDLELPEDIQLIESYDVSHHGGDYAVAGCVVFSKEGKEKSLYRSYNISESNSGNDIGSMKELIERRFLSTNSKKFPGLIIIDGGKAHLSSVVKKLKTLNYLDLNIISISKGIRRKSAFDSIHLMNGDVISVKEGTISHNFIQEIRDETHRYAISLQKRKRAKSTLKSSLDDLSGIGPNRKKILLRYFGSLEQIKRASVDDLSAVSGIGKNIAKSIYREIHS